VGFVPLPSTTSLPGFRILIAEDNPINRKVFEVILRKEAFEIEVVVDGQEALEAHRCRPCDLILMDLHMPEMDGLEATRQIRRLPQKQPVIIAVTADIIPGIRERCLDAGMDDYVAKTVSREQLLELVRTAHERFAAADTIRKAS
jgi:two-component system, sensor histidine kinase and response regulator